MLGSIIFLFSIYSKICLEFLIRWSFAPGILFFTKFSFVFQLQAQVAQLQYIGHTKIRSHLCWAHFLLRGRASLLPETEMPVFSTAINSVQMLLVSADALGNAFVDQILDYIFNQSQFCSICF